jgi:tetratricopeptide (TPR) repeat protein
MLSYVINAIGGDVSKFFLFYILMWLTRNPLLALLIVLFLYFFLDRRYVGLLPDFLAPFRIRRAIGRLKQEVMVNPHNAEALSNLGRELVRMGKCREGVGYLQSALERMSDIPETQYYLGLGYLSLQELELAKNHLQKALQLDPKYGYGEPHLKIGDYHVAGNELDEALKSYEAFTGIHTSSSEGFFKIGEIWLQKGDVQKAGENFQKAVHAFRGSPPHKKRIDRSWYWKARLKLLRMS